MVLECQSHEKTSNVILQPRRSIVPAQCSVITIGGNCHRLATDRPVRWNKSMCVILRRRSRMMSIHTSTSMHGQIR